MGSDYGTNPSALINDRLPQGTSEQAWVKAAHRHLAPAVVNVAVWKSGRVWWCEFFVAVDIHVHHVRKHHEF